MFELIEYDGPVVRVLNFESFDIRLPAFGLLVV